MQSGYASTAGKDKYVSLIIYSSNLDDWGTLNSGGDIMIKHPQYDNETDRRNIGVVFNRIDLSADIFGTYDDEAGQRGGLDITRTLSKVDSFQITSDRVKAKLHLKGPNTDIQGEIDLPRTDLYRDFTEY